MCFELHVKGSSNIQIWALARFAYVKLMTNFTLALFYQINAPASETTGFSPILRYVVQYNWMMLEQTN